MRTSAYPAFQVLFRPVVALQTDSPLQDQGMLRLCPLPRRVRQGAAFFGGDQVNRFGVKVRHDTINIRRIAGGTELVQCIVQQLGREQ